MPKYMPIVKFKKGELDALAAVAAADRGEMLPLVELLDDSVDVDAGIAPATHAAATKLSRAWGTHPVIVDARALEAGGSAGPVVTALFAEFRARNLKAIPLVDLSTSAAFDSAVRAIAATDGRGCVLRLSVDDLVGPLAGPVTAKLSRIGLAAGDVDLILDWGAIEPGSGNTTYLAVAGVVPTLPQLAAWRSVVFAASAFPSNLGAAGVGISTIDRAEWAAYKRLLANVPGGRPLSFGDYTATHAVYSPSPYMGSAAIRYTIEDEWLIVRGRALRNPNYGQFTQFQALSATLVAHAEYRGPAYSAGDEFINECASGNVGTGNLTTWRFVAVNHHIVLVSRQLATYLSPSNGLAPPPVGP